MAPDQGMLAWEFICHTPDELHQIKDSIGQHT